MLDGFEALIGLDLPGGPEEGQLALARDSWVRVLHGAIDWPDDGDEANARRLLHAFAKVAAQARAWPLPCDVVEALGLELR